VSSVEGKVNISAVDRVQGKSSEFVAQPLTNPPLVLWISTHLWPWWRRGAQLGYTCELCCSLFSKWRDHKCNLANRKGGGGLKSTMGTRIFNLRRSQFTQRGKIGLKQSLMQVFPISPALFQFFLFAPSSALTKNNCSEIQKILGWGHLTSFPSSQFRSTGGI
jgi:hypothetical protein